DYGVTIRSLIAVDMKKVKMRKDAVVRLSSEGLEKWLKNTRNLTVIEGQARFADAHRVRVGDELLEADKFFINVGGRASIPPFRGIDQVSYLNNSTMMDEDFSENIKTILEGEGIKIRLGAECIGFEKRGDKVAVQVDCSSGDKAVIGSHTLLAVGRVPNTNDLGVENAGIKVDMRGYIQVDDQLRTNVPGIHALGDCNGRGAFTHTAYNDYEIVAANLLDGDQRRVSDRIMAYALYIDPPLGRAGMTEAEVRKSGRKALIAKRPMTQVGRAREKGETDGFMKVLVDAETKKILGASLLGIECDEVIHSILDVMYANAPYT